MSQSDEIQRACRLGDINLLQQTLQQNPSQINQIDSKLGWAPIYRTVICGHIEATHFLLENGANPNIKTKMGETPLHQVADNSQYHIAELLLKYGGDPNSQQNGKFYSDGDTPLHFSAFRGDEEMTALLLSHRGNPNQRNHVFGRTALHYAVDYDYIEIVKLLLKFQASPYIKDNSGKTCIDLAKRDEIKQLLLACNEQGFQLPGRSLDRVALSPYSSNITSEYSTPKSDISSVENQLRNIENINQTIKDQVFRKSQGIRFAQCVSYRIEESQIEPDAERFDYSTRPSQSVHNRYFSFGKIKRKNSGLLNWLRQLKLENLYEVLIEAGYDDIEQMANQMKSYLPVTSEMLQKIGITKPGHIRRLLAALEEESVDKSPKKRSILRENSNIFKCCVEPLNSTVQLSTSLRQWLNNLGLEMFYQNFLDQGFDDLQQLLALMNTQYKLTDEELVELLKISKPGHRNRIMAKLIEDSAQARSMKTFENRVSICSQENETKPYACELCIIF